MVLAGPYVRISLSFSVFCSTLRYGIPSHRNLFGVRIIYVVKVLLSIAGNELAWNIQIIISFMQEADNVIPTQNRSCGLFLSTIPVGVIKTTGNIRI